MAKKKSPETKPGVRGKCETCVYCRFVAQSSIDQYIGGLCEIGLKLRGVTTLPPEQTCQSWTDKRP